MGVSGNDMGTLEDNPQRHRCPALWHRSTTWNAQMVVTDGVCDPYEPRQRRSETNLSPASVVHQTDPVGSKRRNDGKSDG
jgi:hypothetical protein